MDVTTCCEVGDLETFKRLMNENPKRLEMCGDMCIDYASNNGHLHMVRELLRYGVDPNSRNLEDETPLHNASYFGHLEIVKELLIAGTDISHCVIDAICREGWNALHCATTCGYLDIVRELLKYNADTNKQTYSDGSTALHFAVEDNNLALVQELISHTNLNLKNDGGCTVFELDTTDEIKQYLYEYRYGVDIKEPVYEVVSTL